MDLVGREVELAAVARALSDVRGGGARVLGIAGEAGIGKSALLAAVAARADGLLVVSGRAAEHERDVPFALLREAFVAHVGGLDGVCPLPAPNAAERFQQHHAHRSQIERLGPSVMLFDDLQWADDASLELLVPLLP